MSVRLRRFIECRGVLPTTQFVNKKGLGTCDAFCVWPTPHRVPASRARIVQIDFSAAVGWVNYQGIRSKLSYVGVGDLCYQFSHSFSLIDHNIVVDGCRGKLTNVVLRVTLGSVLCAVDPLVHRGAFLHSAKKSQR